MNFFNCVFYPNEAIAMKLDELSVSLLTIKDQLIKARTEILDKITALETTLANVELPADAQEALTNLVGTAQTLDDIVPDVPVSVEPPEPPEPPAE